MRIGFDISQTGRQKAGCGFYAEGLIKALTEIDKENDYLLYATFGDFYVDPSVDAAALLLSRKLPVALHHRSKTEACKFWAQSADCDAQLSNPDIVHSNNFYAPRQLARARLVYTLYDLSFLDRYEWTTEENRSGCFAGLFTASVTADWIVAISEASKERFAELFPHFPKERISVIYPASRFMEKNVPAKAPKLEVSAKQYWLCVGTVEPRKNHLTLLQSYARLKESGRARYPLVIAGGAGWLMRDLRDTICSMGLERHVLMTGYMEDEELRWLYENALGHVYVSLYEGFGMPILESMGFGLPVVAANTSSMPEIVGRSGEAGLLVDPLSSEDIANAMVKIQELGSDVEVMMTRAKERAAQFSWARSAAALIEVYKRAKAMPKLGTPLPL